MNSRTVLSEFCERSKMAVPFGMQTLVRSSSRRVPFRYGFRCSPSSNLSECSPCPADLHAYAHAAMPSRTASFVPARSDENGRQMRNVRQHQNEAMIINGRSYRGKYLTNTSHALFVALQQRLSCTFKAFASGPIFAWPGAMYVQAASAVTPSKPMQTRHRGEGSKLATMQKGPGGVLRTLFFLNEILQ